MEVEDRRTKTETFLAVTGTEDAAAAEAMLEGNGWNVEGAIDFFFATGTTGPDSSGGSGGGGPALAPSLRGAGLADASDQAAPGSSYSGAQPIADMEDEDRELQMALAASMGQETQVGSSGGFQPPPFPPPTAMPQFQPPSAPIPPHLRTAADDSDDDENTADNDAAVRRTVAQDATGPPGMDGMDEMMDLAMPHGMGMHVRSRPMPGGAGAGGAGAGGDDEDATERAFLEAAMKESLDAPQPSMADEDDPLLAEAIQASLRAADDDADAGAEQDSRSMIERFPALRAQLEAEQRAAAGGGGHDGMAAAMAAAMGGDFDDFAPSSQTWQPPAPASPGTLEARRVRQEQDQAYQESLEMDRIREQSTQQAALESKEAEARIMAESAAAAQAQEEAANHAAAELDKLKSQLPAEPPAGADVATVVVRLQDGSRLAPRRFNNSDKIADVYAHVSIEMQRKNASSNQTFELVSNMPMRSFKDKHLTLAQAQLEGQTLLIVQPV